MVIVWLIFVIALGACAGSFLNVVIHRLPRGESIVFPGSHCPACGRPIRWFDNLPLLSWFMLRGRCRQCRVAISPRYVVIEAATAIRVGGLFACYYILRLRGGAGQVQDSWPIFASHAALLCGLLACSVVDLEQFQIPLEVMWACAIIGMVAATGGPHFGTLAHPGLLPRVSPFAGAIGLAAAAGLAVSLALLNRGFLQPSFLDAVEAPPATAEDSHAKRKEGPARRKAAGSASASKKTKAPAAEKRILTPRMVLEIVAATVTAALLAYVPGARPSDEAARNIALSKEHGVNPRKEILWEIAFLVPPLALAGAAAIVMGRVPAARHWWDGLFNAKLHPLLAPHLAGFASAVFGYMIGGLWVWATRILGTLAFNKEAMGMGDVHILAAVGAVCGWIVPSLTFFVAPFIGLGWAMYQWIARRRGVVAYGPLLATGTLIVLVFYDPIFQWIEALLTGGR
jgi:leader peptidase (prepilin peptidase) / N-methyltransferase